MYAFKLEFLFVFVKLCVTKIKSTLINEKLFVVFNLIKNKKIKILSLITFFDKNK